MATLTAFLLFIMVIKSHCDIVVEVKQGLLRGTVLTSVRSNKTFIGFMGIPYGKPPVGDLRFKAPNPAGTWEGLRDAIEEGSKCPQTNIITETFEGEEDCLFLNVFTPKVPSGLDDTPIPVMVWIHGGGFFFGSGNRDFAGPDYLVEEEIVFVSINYRLGVLGFLSVQNEDAPGNAGLKDQVLALQWVRNNIKQFGGDREKVTIFGESAGAASVHYHLMSPMSKGLFQCAISQSGSALNQWGYQSAETSLKNAFLLGSKIGVNTSDTNVLVQQLRSFTTLQLIEAYNSMMSGKHDLYFTLPMCPTTDTHSAPGEVFLTDTPTNLMKAGMINDVPYIAGINSHEGIVMTRAIKWNLNRTTEENIKSVLSGELTDTVKDNLTSNEIVSKINNFYFGDITGYNATLLQYVNFTSDVYFVNGVYCSVKRRAAMSNAPVYTYEFSFSGRMSVFKKFFGGEDLPGAAHADDVGYIFTTPFVTLNLEPESPEVQTSERLVKMWTNFAKTGNPTPLPVPLLQNITWTPVTQSNFHYLSIDTELSMQLDPKKVNTDFWEELYQNYSKYSLCMSNR